MGDNKFYLEKLTPLVGGKITSLADTEDGFFGFVITLPNKKKKAILFLRDDEGNGPGSFELQDA